jgi:hypothetical protein
MNAAPNATTPEEYLAALPEPRQAALRALDAAIREAAPLLKPGLGHGMLGYGPFHYKYASGREGDTFVVCLASQKQHISLYLCACNEEGYLAEQAAKKLGQVSVGKSCIRFKKLEDLHLAAAMSLVKEAAALYQAGKLGLTS